MDAWAHAWVNAYVYVVAVIHDLQNWIIYVSKKTPVQRHIQKNRTEVLESHLCLLHDETAVPKASRCDQIPAQT